MHLKKKKLNFFFDPVSMNSDIKSLLKTSTVHQLSYLTVWRTDYLTAHFKIRKQVQLEGYDTLQIKKKRGTHPPYFTSSGLYKYRNYSFNAHILHRMLDCPTTCFLFIRWKDFYWDSCWDNIPPLLVHQPWCCWPFGSGDIAVNRGPTSLLGGCQKTLEVVYRPLPGGNSFYFDVLPLCIHYRTAASAVTATA